MSGERKGAPAAGSGAQSEWGQRSSLMSALEGARRKLGGRSVTPSARSPGALVEATERFKRTLSFAD